VSKISFSRSLLRLKSLGPFSLLFDLVRWLPVAAAVGMLAGTASALLLVSLNLAASLREAYPWFIWLLAPAGVLVGLMYHYLGRSVEGGNNLILQEIHSPARTIPLRMTPLILLGTFLTHVFGGSAGREGSAVQTGASLADQLARPLRMKRHDRRILLMMGVSAGFGSVFGTPLAGAIFGIEVLSIGQLSYEALAPCMLASFAGDLVTRMWRVQHTVYRVDSVPSLSIVGILSAIAAGIVFGLVAMAFAKTTHAIAHAARKAIPYAPLRPAAGGILVTLAAVGSHTTKYLGLGIPTIVAAFHEKLPAYDWAAKFLFTAVTLGSGFKGGEVTPLFFIGSTLGNALSHVLALPPSLLAGMGFAAVFAGAANTPIASTLMAAELFGAEAGAYAGIACIISYLCSGHAGIYHAQQVGHSKRRSLTQDEGLSLAMIAKGEHKRKPDDKPKPGLSNADLL
jgi:H+/Cl- antiporter ClcA